MSRALILVIVLWAAFAVRVTVKAFVVQQQPVPLRQSFDRLPMDLLGPGWTGEDSVLDESVIERAQISQYVQRNYWRAAANLWLYVGYVDRWKPGSIHHPEICFPGSGYELVSQQDVLLSAPGFDQPMSFKEFFWTSPRGGGTYTLFSFYYNGKLEPNDWRLRLDSIAGVRYFAVVTLSGNQLGSVEETRAVYQDALKRIMPQLVKHFAD